MLVSRRKSAQLVKINYPICIPTCATNDANLVLRTEPGFFSTSPSDWSRKQEDSESEAMYDVMIHVIYYCYVLRIAFFGRIARWSGVGLMATMCRLKVGWMDVTVSEALPWRKASCAEGFFGLFLRTFFRRIGESSCLGSWLDGKTTEKHLGRHYKQHFDHWQTICSQRFFSLALR